MKLSAQQIQALAEKIYRELNADVDKKNKEIKDKKQEFINKKLGLKENKVIRELVELNVGKNDYYAKEAVNCYIRNKYKAEYEKLGSEASKKVDSSNTIRIDLIVETIECENIDEVIARIKKKYA